MSVNRFSSNPVVAGPALPPGYKRGEPSSSSDEGEPEVAVKRARTAGDRPAEWVHMWTVCEVHECLNRQKTLTHVSEQERR